MKILGLDVATATGWAIYDTAKQPSSIVSGSIKLKGSNAFEKTQSMKNQLVEVIKEYQPDFCVIESPLSFIPQFRKKTKTHFGVQETTTTINANTIMQLNHLFGAAQMLVLGSGIECHTVRPQTWQAIVPGSATGDSKAKVAKFCDQLGIISPNKDSRDASIIAVWAAGYVQKIKMMEGAA